MSKRRLSATESIRSLAQAGRYVLTVHAERERQSDEITTSELESALQHCEIIEDYPNDPRGHSCLVLGFADTRPVHVVCALKGDPREILVVTVYDPSLSPDKWDSSFRGRRKA
jgi:uncharacterized protein DUF4258